MLKFERQSGGHEKEVCAPQSRLVRALAAVPNVRAAAFRQSATEVGVEGLTAVATSTTAQTTLAGLAFNGLDGIAPTGRGLLIDAQRGFAFGVDCTQAKEFALSRWLVNGADVGRVFVRCFGGDGIVRENAAGDALASLTTMAWNAPSKSWTGGATMADASLNRRMTVRLADPVAFAQIGAFGLDGQIELEALRLYGLPSLALGAVHLVDVTVPGARQGDRAEASLASSTRFIELDAFAWTNDTIRALARNVSGGAFDLGAATLSVAVTKRRIP